MDKVSIQYFEQRKQQIIEKFNEITTKKNEKKFSFNGTYERYQNPVVTRDFIPLEWRYDFSYETNPYFLERIGVNATFNSGAMFFEGKYVLVVRVEGNDRKSYFAIARSDNGIDNFKFDKYPILTS